MSVASTDRYASAVAGKLGLDPALVRKMTINLDPGNVVTVNVEIMVPREQVDTLLMTEPEEPTEPRPPIAIDLMARDEGSLFGADAHHSIDGEPLRWLALDGCEWPATACTGHRVKRTDG